MKFYLLLLGLLLPVIINAQIFGSITDENGEALPFVSIYIKGSSQGTTSNIDGEYRLNLSPGQYDIVYQYVGKQTINRKISIGDDPKQVNIILKSQATLLDEVTIAADAEDPAYRVIRNAQRKRKYYQNLIKHFTCDVYVKGNQKIEDAPEKIMGIEVGDMEGALDSNRQGIVYLSESISKLYFKSPDHLKEVVYSSKVSGDDSGYSFNTAREMEFNVYDRTMDFSRQLVSPIAENAMSYYKYRLEGTFYDDGRLINKIKLIRKRDTDPSFYGTIYIVEDLWNVHSAEVGVTAKASQLYFLDSVEVEQVFVPIKEPDVWRIFSNNISFKLGILGFKLKGNFSATYSNYDLTTPIDDDIFNSEVFVVEKDSNKKDSIYWAENRPTPLTIEEKEDYVKKDSIQQVRESPEYKDSIDRKNNKLELGDILGGYTHSNSNTHTYWSIGSPLSHVGFNAVQGVNASIDLSWWKYFDKEHTNRIIVDGNVSYGFSEEKVRGNGRLIYRPNRLDRSYVFISGGSDIKQINKYAPQDELRNTLYSLFAKRNYAKYYDYTYAKVGLGKEVSNGLILNALFGYERRLPLQNNSDYSFFKKDSRVYEPNNLWVAQGSDVELPFVTEQKLFNAELTASIRFNQEYFVYPDRKFSSGDSGPTLGVKYRYLEGLGEDYRLHALTASLSNEFIIGSKGNTTYFLEGGSVLSKENLQPIDYFHFRGNQFTISSPESYSNSFLALPVYGHSTDGSFVQAHIQHHFDGYIMDKIPGINKLGFGLVAGAKFLYAQDRDEYYELHLGIDKIGWHVLRLFRFDVVRSSVGGEADWAYRIGVKISGSN